MMLLDRRTASKQTKPDPPGTMYRDTNTVTLHVPNSSRTHTHIHTHTHTIQHSTRTGNGIEYIAYRHVRHIHQVQHNTTQYIHSTPGISPNINFVTRASRNKCPFFLSFFFFSCTAPFNAFFLALHQKEYMYIYIYIYSYLIEKSVNSQNKKKTVCTSF
ncbi:hypothetical protein BD289DRAFT_51786 [Coniella lustricola]|uniref:Uncharacterized protein n=1 Tax=Coniella lustricola TaxID=2025994 RepID=A0A2T3A150_9PEZI|nr:hypothetical protein BD289DRAFT_51786 [Coniella lustricola]